MRIIFSGFYPFLLLLLTLFIFIDIMLLMLLVISNEILTACIFIFMNFYLLPGSPGIS